MPDFALDILLDDDAIIAVNKPAGLLTQAPLGIDSLEVRIKQLLSKRQSQPGDVYLGVPHRLDRPVSGIILFAKTLKAAQKISRQFERRWVEKSYSALVEGAVEPAAGTWTDHLKKVYGKPRSQVVAPDDPAGQLAVLHYQVADRIGDTATLLDITLETGRTHQIRIQCASRGHPLMGDELYGSGHPFGPWSDDERERLIALHARRLKFRHPTTQQDITLVAPLPPTWHAAGVHKDPGASEPAA